MTVRIEVIAAPGCRRCARARDRLHAVAVAVLGEGNFLWREVDVLREFDYAVSLGLQRTPAIAVNGRLRCATLPSPAQWRALLAALAPH